MVKIFKGAALQSRFLVSKELMIWKAEMFLLKISTTLPGSQRVPRGFPGGLPFFVQMDGSGAQFRRPSQVCQEQG